MRLDFEPVAYGDESDDSDESDASSGDESGLSSDASARRKSRKHKVSQFEMMAQALRDAASIAKGRNANGDSNGRRRSSFNSYIFLDDVS